MLGALFECLWPWQSGHGKVAIAKFQKGNDLDGQGNRPSVTNEAAQKFNALTFCWRTEEPAMLSFVLHKTKNACF
jgi:hypothetical protein